ncbi:MULTISPECIES: class I SAM-dependent methyltransferase [Xanthomonas]|uniref:Methyltransferase type 11 n=1 Tax=Xanthomonas phaseoli pv. dieffenbachiae TaxID=92828 RepID=A0A1V9H6C9_9XANT|nr:class I SAM-dependent methyltransferase [Xanthomonas phaseoli]MBO9768127.1 class I SAM-dependent methyltransferase [Xanthomonas phaseoli pv. dieffenbachiae]MBO9776399.1 class I SAM-dependent methyltransferase [Xanthomonas phaseoli pv. dieffenbachiae]MBO9778684.1 class I SAM-dependent methyltransferase [Xanthomonas phaseoli pv. dieffenbachiae]MBO9787588.1 class I SAM-dependent methyltransferase [Xanthomonas phaseoli pv. dieffenbachiae]MBO9797886.1 class I SAM-dependent methyltransferase [Xan
MPDIDHDLDVLYQHRFPKEELANKNRIWQVLCTQYFSRFVKPNETVVDIGAGYCEFINNIPAAHKIAVDLNPDVRKFAADGIRVINESCIAVSSIPSASVDAVFMSNFLEHLPTKDLVLQTLRESARMLKPGGRVIILQPNIRFLYDEYWDYFDHHTALSDRSLVEGVLMAGLEPQVVIPKFLPYTTKSRLPQAPWLVSLYLRIPLAWHFLGKQALVVAYKRG